MPILGARAITSIVSARGIAHLSSTPTFDLIASVRALNHGDAGAGQCLRQTWSSWHQLLHATWGFTENFWQLGKLPQACGLGVAC